MTEQVIRVYVDGSFRENRNHAGGHGGIGVAYRTPTGQRIWVGRAIALGLIANSEEAELRALEEGSRVADQLLLRHFLTRLEILSDHKGVVEAMKERHEDFKYQRHLAALDNLRDRGCAVVIDWVQAHSGITGNEYADKLAKYASREAQKSPNAGDLGDPTEVVKPHGDVELLFELAAYARSLRVRHASRRERKNQQRRGPARGYDIVPTRGSPSYE